MSDRSRLRLRFCDILFEDLCPWPGRRSLKVHSMYLCFTSCSQFEFYLPFTTKFAGITNKVRLGQYTQHNNNADYKHGSRFLANCIYLSHYSYLWRGPPSLRRRANGFSAIRQVLVPRRSVVCSLSSRIHSVDALIPSVVRSSNGRRER